MNMTDEDLMAYVDGERGSVTDAIAEKQRTGFTPSEALLIADFHRTRQAVRDAFAIDTSEPLPSGLAETILGYAQIRPSRTGSAKTLRPPGRLLSDQSYSVRNSAIAACLALAVGVAGWQLNAPPQEFSSGFASGPVGAGSALASVLETQPAGAPVATSSVSSPYAYVMVAGTFRDRNSRHCREVELLDATLAPRQAAVACRAPSGNGWSVEASAVVAQANGTESITPAGAPEADVLGALMKMLGFETALSPDDERKLLESGWK